MISGTFSERNHFDQQERSARAKERRPRFLVQVYARWLLSHILLLLWLPAAAQVGAGPVAPVRPAALPEPRDRPFQGRVQLDVDASDVAHGIFRVTETVPIQSPGEMILLYPEWETTSHAPTESVAELAGLQIRSDDGSLMPWRRDIVDVHAFHLTVPTHAHSLTLTFEYLPSSFAEIRPNMIDVQWQHLLLYPAGWYARDIPVLARLAVPSGLYAFTALRTTADQPASANFVRSGDRRMVLTFAPESLERLVDAPVYLGRYVRQEDLGSAVPSPVHLDLVADSPEDLAITPAELAQLRKMIVQTGDVFGRAPFSHYDALVSLSDKLSPGGGLEHLEEGENNLPASYFMENGKQLNNRDLIVHEYVHAWNGRYRQPTALWSPNFNLPTDPSLLWVYEGQTEFWGRVLAARSGIRTYQETLDKLALDAALVAQRTGRTWKTLSDSTLDPLYMSGHPITWRDWQRREDYYPEGVLLWLDVDARLRELSHGAVSLDDFARRFFAAKGHSGPVSTYTFDDVCETLNSLAPGEWKDFLNKHLLTHATSDAMAGLVRAGWRLVYTSDPSETFLQDEADSGVTNLDSSIGLQIREDGTMRSVVWNGPAFQAGLRPGLQVSKVNGQPFTLAVLLSAVRTSRETPLRLTLRGGTSDVQIPYTGPLRYPSLQRIPDTPDLLEQLIKPR